jgi:Zinc-uptake complex component A periplasmic
MRPLATQVSLAASAQEMRINVVAAENFYGDIAGQIAGGRANIVSIISNPDQDPHLFETTPSVVCDIAAARTVILNGANYDTWMEKLLKASPQPPGRWSRWPISSARRRATTRICGMRRTRRQPSPPPSLRPSARRILLTVPSRRTGSRRSLGPSNRCA